MTTEQAAARVPGTERVTMTGRLEPQLFVPWIARYAGKLGLVPQAVTVSDGRIELVVAGEAALIEMLAIGCSLGPMGVWVETVEQRPAHEPA